MESEFLSGLALRAVQKVVLWKGLLVSENWEVLQMLIKGNLLLSFFVEIPCAELKDQAKRRRRRQRRSLDSKTQRKLAIYGLILH